MNLHATLNQQMAIMVGNPRAVFHILKLRIFYSSGERHILSHSHILHLLEGVVYRQREMERVDKRLAT